MNSTFQNFKFHRLFFAALFAWAMAGNMSFAQTTSSPATVTKERTLSEFESSLVGKWYTSGDLNKLSYIASSGSMLFSINEIKDTLELYGTENSTLIAKRQDYETSAVVSGDYILWSNGCWWSRHPVTLGARKP